MIFPSSIIPLNPFIRSKFIKQYNDRLNHQTDTSFWFRFLLLPSSAGPINFFSSITASSDTS